MKNWNGFGSVETLGRLANVGRGDGRAGQALKAGWAARSAVASKRKPDRIMSVYVSSATHPSFIATP